MRSSLQANHTLNAFVAALIMLALLSVSYFVFEPVTAYGVTKTFTVTQQITSEISFKTDPNNVTMTPSISGLTGDNAFGTSTFAINTNNTTGYNMTIQFSTSTAMQGTGSTTSDINNYGPASAGTPDYTWSVGPNTAEFGYTVNSVTTATDIDARFKDNGSACNTGTGTTVGKCWYGITNAATPVGILNRTTATPGTGATSTVVFQVGVTANPIPALQSGFYQATATLTAVTNP